jgi:steroid delta-isomerase-like uncharacterized protein
VTSAVLTALKDAWESGDADAAADLYSEASVFEDGVGPAGTRVQGREAIRQLLADHFAEPEARFQVVSLFDTDEGGMAEWTYSWRATASGARAVLRGVSVIVIESGLITRESSYYDPKPELI